MKRDNQYEMLDAGGGRKLERFGQFVLDRPCAQAVWRPQLEQSSWLKADGVFFRGTGGKSHWEFRNKAVAQGWQCKVGELEFILRPTDFGHIGIFPEHSLGWQRIAQASKNASRQLNVLNLFAYSGGATLAAAMAGNAVCHLDASKKMVDWARENAAANHLEDKPIRWIVDDVRKFLQREIRRGRKYDGIILDPPSFGRGTNQELFQIDSNMLDVLSLCRQVLSDTPAYVMLTCHTPGYTPMVLEHLMEQSFPVGRCECGEMALPCHPGALPVPSGAYAWWTPA